MAGHVNLKFQISVTTNAAASETTGRFTPGGASACVPCHRRRDLLERRSPFVTERHVCPARFSQRDPGASRTRPLCRRPQPCDRRLSLVVVEAPALPRGRGGRRQDRNRQGTGGDAWPTPHPAAKLLGARHRLGGLRVELSPADDRGPPPRWRRGEPRHPGGGDLIPTPPHQTPPVP